MNLPKGYANLATLSVFLHEARNTTIARAKAGDFKTAKQFGKAKLNVWMIQQSELFEIMAKHREEVPALQGFIRLEFKQQYLGTETKEAKAKLSEVLTSLLELFSVELDKEGCAAWVEEG